MMKGGCGSSFSFQYVYECSYERSENGNKEDGSEISREGERVDCLDSFMQMIWFCGEMEEDLKVMEGRFVEVWRRRFESQCR